MFLKSKTPQVVIGLSFSKEAVHAVAVRTLGAGDVQIEQAVSVPMPPSALGERDINEESLVIDVVRDALSRMPGGAGVVIGLPSPATIAHAVTLPSVSPKERRAIVRGEIDLLNLLPPGQEAFDFVVFARPEGVVNKDNKGDTAFFFAAEQHIVEQYRACVVEAGASVVGMEPCEYAAVRTTRREFGDVPTSLAISLGAHHTYLQFFLNGLPVYARRLDVGAEQIGMPPASSAYAVDEDDAAGSGQDAPSEESAEDMEVPPASPWQLLGLTTPGAVAPAFLPATAPGPELVGRGSEEVVRERMLTEISRSIEYFGREFGQETADMPVVLLTNYGRMTEFHAQAVDALDQAVLQPALGSSISLASDLEDLLLHGPNADANRAAFGPALGLALGFQTAWGTVPRFDLAQDAAEAARARQAPRQLIAAGSAALILLGAGGGMAWALEQQTVPVRSELESSDHALQSLNLQEQKLRTDSLEQMELVRQIRMKNMPWTNVLQNVAQAVPSGVALTKVTVLGGALSITADAGDPKRVVQFWSRMNTSPFFAGAVVTSFQRGEDKITFQMNVTLPAEAIAPTTPAKNG